MSKKINLTVLLVICILGGCAQVVNDSGESIEMKTLNAFVQTYYSGAELINPQDTTHGYFQFILRGTGGGSIPNDSCQLDLDYNVHVPSEIQRISKTTVKQKAKLYGLFSYEQHYIPERLFKEQIRENILNVIKKMNVGDSLILILPSRQCNTGGTLRVNTNNSSTPLIYGITLKNIIINPKQTEEKTMIAFKNRYNDSISNTSRHLREIDTLPNFYMRYIDTTERKDTTTLVSQDTKTITVEYAGYFTDGFMFDSNINKLLVEKNPTIDTTAQTFIDNNLKKGSYVYYTDSTKVSYIQGWHKAFQFLKKGDKAEFFFSSDYGYGKYGNTTIFGHTPLRFYIHVKDVN